MQKMSIELLLLLNKLKEISDLLGTETKVPVDYSGKTLIARALILRGMY